MNQPVQYTLYERTPVTAKWHWLWGALAVIIIALHIVPVVIFGNVSAYEVGQLIGTLGIPAIAALITFSMTKFKEPIWALMMFTSIAALALFSHLVTYFGNLAAL